MLIGLITGLVVFCFNVIGFKLLYFPGDLGDARLIIYSLEHSHKYFTGQLSSFWNAPFIFPEKEVMSYSETLVGFAPLFSFFRLMTFDIYTSFQLWFVVVSSLNYIMAFYFLQYVFKNNYAAVLGAFVFAFSIALQSQLTHAQTFSRFPIPLAFFMAVKFSEKYEPRYFFFTLLSVVYQIYCGIYLGFMLAVSVAIYVCVIMIKKLFFEKHIMLDYKWHIHIVLSGLLNMLILLPLLLPYMRKKIAPGIDHYNQIVNTIPTIKSHFFSQEGSLVWDFLSKTGIHYQAWWDHQIFAGAIATICLMIGFSLLFTYAVKSKFNLQSFSVPLLLFLTGFITFFLYMRFDKLSAYIILYFLPGFSSMRSMTRIINIELIFFATAIAFVFTNIFEKYPKYRSLVFILSFIVLVCDNYFHQEKSYKTLVSIAQTRTDALEKTFSKIPAGSIVSYEPLQIESLPIHYHIDAMLISQQYNQISVNGYTGYCPGDYGMYWNDPNEKTRNYWLRDKKINNDILYVVKAPDIIEKVYIKDIQNTNWNNADKTRLEDVINYIKTDKKWMKVIEKKAKEKEISIDSMLMLDAKWVIENDK